MTREPFVPLLSKIYLLTTNHRTQARHKLWRIHFFKGRNHGSDDEDGGNNNDDDDTTTSPHLLSAYHFMYHILSPFIGSGKLSDLPKHTQAK